MPTKIGTTEIPNTDDIVTVSDTIYTLMEKLSTFLSTHPTPVKISTSIQNIF